MNEEQRLINLETKFSHQELQIEELNQLVHEQYQMIEKLEKSLKLLKEKHASEEDCPIRSHEKPPHY